MISYLEGIVVARGEHTLTIATGGVGYTLVCTSKLQESVTKIGVNVKVFVHTQMNMREGVFDLFGFLSERERELFVLLTSVSGIGPKNAMSILATVDPALLKAAVLKEDAEYLRTVSGLGPKTAKRLIIELKTKIEGMDVGLMPDIDLDAERQAMEALIALGYSAYQAKDALSHVSTDARDARERVRDALRVLSKHS
ncbi:MAG: Holliday junction branch migration protein RuvA [Patescibacteria group bacterium]